MTRCSTVLLACLGACGGGNGSGSDASPDTDAGAIPADANVGPDGTTPLAWVDFTITGCEAESAQAGGLDAGVPAPCTGAAPLALTFTSVAPAAIEIHNWDFGDTNLSMEASPAHVYADPGSYDVGLIIGGPGGTAQIVKPGVVEVRAAPLGARCDADDQCASGLCVCDSITTCPPGVEGICSAVCGAATPCSDGVCADLAPAPTATPEDWQRSLCLPECAGDPDCPDGLHCRELHKGDGLGWVNSCFTSAVLADIGQPCADLNGAPDDSLCSTGTCWNEGARGMCSESCTPGSCPGSSACADFVGGSVGSFCVARCDNAGDCTDDPWLACEPPGGTGTRNFTIDEAAAVGGYCAPKNCTMADECGVDGACTDGFCAAP